MKRKPAAILFVLILVNIILIKMLYADIEIDECIKRLKAPPYIVIVKIGENGTAKVIERIRVASKDKSDEVVKRIESGNFMQVKRNRLLLVYWYEIISTSGTPIISTDSFELYSKKLIQVDAFKYIDYKLLLGEKKANVPEKVPRIDG